MSRIECVVALAAACAGLAACMPRAYTTEFQPGGLYAPYAPTPRVSAQERRRREMGDWSADDARGAAKIEMSVDEGGGAEQIEFHVDPASVPAAVRAAMDARHPGGPYTGAEKEYVGGSLYWELTREVDGHAVEALFHPDGTLFGEEIELPESDVPGSVKDAVASAWSGDSVRSWEAIKDRGGVVTEYHVKLDAGGQAIKAIVSPGGALNRVAREVPAEIEVPLPLPK
jgi:hypothetical protein